MNYKLLLYIIGMMFIFVNASAQRRALGKRSVQKTLAEQKTVIAEDTNDPIKEIKKNETFQTTTTTQTFVSDIDINIPQTTQIENNTFAVIIANENYTEVENVPYALRDGELFKTYCVKALGIPETNIHYVADATLNNIKKQVRWLSEVISTYGGDAKVIFYYSGHGIPDEKNKDAYLLPIDGYGSDYETGYALNELYETLGEMPTKSVVVFLDACFSGSKRDGGMLASARGVAIKTKPSKPQGNMVVFSAAQGDETALPYAEQQHGLFTYFLLKKIQEEGGNITLGTLGEYVISEVKKRSVVVNQKIQTPTINSSVSLYEEWKNIYL